MKRLLIRFFALLAIASLIGSCSNVFTGTNLSDPTVLEARTGLNNVLLTAVSKNLTVTPGGGLTAATDQYWTLTLGEHVDQGTLSAIKFYMLTATAATDGGRTQGPALTPEDSTFKYDGDNTVIVYKFNLSSTASVSDFIQMIIDPTVLTANNGTVKLNRDGDEHVGEAKEDEYVTEIAVAGAGIVAGGAAWIPPSNLAAKLTFAAPPIGGFVLGSSAITATFSANYDLAADTIAAAVKLQKFNSSTLSWDAVTPSSTTYAAGVFTFNLSSAIANGETYQIFVNEYAIVEKTTNRGYLRRVSFDNDRVNILNTGPTSFGADSKYNSAWNIAADATHRDTQSRNVYLDITIGTIGAQGIDPLTATTANIRLYDTTLSTFIPISSISVHKSNPAAAQENDLLRITLPPAYKYLGTNGYAIFVSPNVKDLGATTAATDDVSMGDWTNCTTWPFLYMIIAGTATI